jgi:hypothetical protein
MACLRASCGWPHARPRARRCDGSALLGARSTAARRAKWRSAPTVALSAPRRRVRAAHRQPTRARAGSQAAPLRSTASRICAPLALAPLRDIGVSAADDDYGPCPTITRAGEQLGWQAIRARSAANPDGTALAIFHDAFPPRGRWHVDTDATRPSVRTAYLTRYRAGERPAWPDTTP